MKHLLALALCASVALGFSSCDKDLNLCYECTHPDKCDVSICNEKVTEVDSNALCGLVPDKNGSTNKEYKNAYESEGFTCKIK